jgi:hypothetical protein
MVRDKKKDRDESILPVRFFLFIRSVFIFAENHKNKM